MQAAHVLKYGDQNIPYSVREDNQRTTRIAIHVDPDGSVIVDAPPDFDDASVRAAVQKRARWVLDHVKKAHARFENVRQREYVSGEQILYLGRRYVLKVTVTEGKPGPVRLKGNRLEVEVKSADREAVRRRVRDWYRLKADSYFKLKITDAAKRLPWMHEPPPLRLQEMKKQWGSCSASGQIILNPHLIKAPRTCVEYVVIHELAHLRYHHHGSEFWKLLDVHIPGWRKAKKELDHLAELILKD